MCLVEWRHSSELNSCLFKQGVAEETLGLVTCCQHTENEATSSHRTDPEGSGSLVTGHTDPAQSLWQHTAWECSGWSRSHCCLEQRPLLCPSKGPEQYQGNYSSPDPCQGVTALLQAMGPQAGADTVAPKGSQQPYEKGILGRGFSSGGVLSLKAVAPEWKSAPGDARCPSG